MVKTLTCPICGKKYTNTNDLINCIKKDEELESKQNKVKEAEKANAKDEIMKTYKQFKERIEQFNKEFAPDHFDINISYRGSQVTRGYTPSIEKSSELENKLKNDLGIGEAKSDEWTRWQKIFDHDDWEKLFRNIFR